MSNPSSFVTVICFTITNTSLMCMVTNPLAHEFNFDFILDKYYKTSWLPSFSFYWFFISFSLCKARYLIDWLLTCFKTVLLFFFLSHCLYLYISFFCFLSIFYFFLCLIHLLFHIRVSPHLLSWMFVLFVTKKLIK